ncbi:MAG: glutamyl-tRNA reductase [Candidatus Latescibacteria bacterium]|nr:glutamyl-tRNA reductase [Candidatus Latescibacterota bacterium]
MAARPYRVHPQLADCHQVHILALGLNHTTAPVEIREKLAFPEPVLPQALRELTGRYGLCEAAILSTCNRAEIYAASEGESEEGLWRFLAEVHGVDQQRLQPHCYQHRDGEVAGHLFRVACGIDSLVIGESQILAQVRTALEAAQQNGAARLLINELFQRSLHVGKRARSETQIGRGRLSISTAAVELAGQVFERLEGRQALLLGAGEMAELTAQYLVESGINNLLVANRTLERAQDLARRFQGQAIPFDQMSSALTAVDIAISSTSAPGFVLLPKTIQQVMRQRRGRPLFLIDIAVPRDIDPAVKQLDNVFLFDIDDLEQVVRTNRQEREGEILKVQGLIEEELKHFLHWFNAQGTGPLIQALHRRAEELRQAEIERWSAKLAHLSEQDRQLVEGLLRGYANKMLHQPLVQIREFANTEDGYLRLDTVRRLFGLGGPPEQEG